MQCALCNTVWQSKSLYCTLLVCITLWFTVRHCITLYWGKFVCYFRKISTIQSFPMKKFERRDDSILHSYIDFCWPLTTSKNNQPRTPQSMIFAAFRVLLLPEIPTTIFIFEENTIFFPSPTFCAQVQKNVFRGS